MASPAWKRRRRQVRVAIMTRRIWRQNGNDRRAYLDTSGYGWLTQRQMAKINRALAKRNHW